MQELIDMASELGKKIAANQRTKTLKKAQQAAQDDSDAGKLLEEYQAQAQKLQTLQEQQKPIEPDDKRKLADLETKISANPALSELSRRQADFIELMRKVKQAIDAELKV